MFPIGKVIWDALAGTLRGAFSWAFQFVAGYGSGVVTWLVDTLVSALPDALQPGDLVTIKAYLEILNAWVPVDLFLVFVAAYVTARIGVGLGRMVLKLIPGLG